MGIGILAEGLEGYLVKIGRLQLWTRPFLVIGGLLIAFPEWKTTIAGASLVLLVTTIIQIRRKATATKLITEHSGRKEV